MAAHTPAEVAETPEAPDALGQPVAPAETEPVAAPTGETLLVQPFPVDQGLVDGEVSAPAVAPAMVEMPQTLTAPAEEQQKQSEAQPVPSSPETSQEADAEAGADALAVPAPETEPADNARWARHAATTAQTPADAAPENVVENSAEAAVPAEPELASPTQVAQSSGTAESAYEPVAIPAVEHAGSETVAAPTGETVAPDQLELALTPADAAGHEGDEVTLDLSEEAGGLAQKGAPEVAVPVADTAETARAAGPVDVTDVAEAADAVDELAPEAPLSSGAEPTSAPTASTPEGQPEDHAAPEAQAEQVPAEHPQAQEDLERPLEPAETVVAQTPEAETAAEDRPNAEEEQAEPVDPAEQAEPNEPAEPAEAAEPTPAPWGSADLRQQIYTEVQEFVAAIARRDVNELASRYGIAGNDLAGLDEQLAGLSSPASDLTLYPVEQADDYVDGHHRLDLSELEGGGVVISSELWAHDAACGARLIAHWNPMGIYPFDFRNVSM